MTLLSVIQFAPVDPDRAYAAWAVHAERCPRCAGSGELDPEHLCRDGRLLLETWLASEPAASPAGWRSARSSGDQTRINLDPAPA